MPAQPDLFGPAKPAGPPPISPEMVQMVRAELHARLDRVRTAAMIPWDNNLELVKIENFVRYNKHILPPDEAAAIWSEVDFHLDRLYAVLDEGLPEDAEA